MSTGVREDCAAARDDAGSVSLLTLGWLVVVAIAVLVVAAATQVHLDRTRLVSLADELALSAADALDMDAYYAGDLSEPRGEAGVKLAHDRMEEAVARHLEQSARSWRGDVVILDVSSPDGSTSSVTVGRTVRPLFGIAELAPWWDGIPLVVEGRARAS